MQAILQAPVPSDITTATTHIAEIIAPLCDQSVSACKEVAHNVIMHIHCETMAHEVLTSIPGVPRAKHSYFIQPTGADSSPQN